MTAKQRLEQLVADLGEEEASRALGLLEPLAEDRSASGRPRALPSFVGIGDSGRSDISEHVNRFLSDGFGE